MASEFFQPGRMQSSGCLLEVFGVASEDYLLHTCLHKFTSIQSTSKTVKGIETLQFIVEEVECFTDTVVLEVIVT